jgi:hypothetical protein
MMRSNHTGGTSFSEVMLIVNFVAVETLRYDSCLFLITSYILNHLPFPYPDALI